MITKLKSQNLAVELLTIKNWQRRLFFLILFSIILLVGGQTFAQKYPWLVHPTGGTGNDRAYRIVLDNSGNRYAIGYFQGTINFEGTNLTSAGGNDIFLAKFNNTGTLLWVKRAGGTGDDRGFDVAIHESTGTIFISGLSSGTANFDAISVASNAGSQDIFAAKYDSNGNALWAVKGGGTADDAAEGIAIDNNGDCYITGGIRGGGTFGGISISNIGGYDIFFGKLNGNTGAPIWAYSLGSGCAEGGKDIDIDDNDNIYISGSFNCTVDFDPSIGVSNRTSAGSYDQYLGKYDTDGNLIWIRSGGGSAFDGGNTQIAIDNNGNIFQTGGFQGSANYSGTNLTSAGSYDILVLKYAPNGNLIWAKKEGGSAREIGFDISIDNQNNIYLTGETNNSFTLGGFSLNHAGNKDIFTAKLDNNGNVLWADALGNTGDDTGWGIFSNSEDEVYLSGEFSGIVNFGSTTKTSSGGTDAYIAQYNPLAKPTNLSAAANTTTQIDLSWDDNAVSETGYKIERSVNDNTNFVEITFVGANTTNYTDNTVNPATKYYYRVRAYNVNGDSNYSNEVEASTLNFGLVAYYPFNGNANDESGNGNNGIVNGASLADDRCGTPMSAYEFDGIDDVIGIENFRHPVGQGTITFWVKVEDDGYIMDTKNNFRTASDFGQVPNEIRIGYPRVPICKNEWLFCTYTYSNGTSPSGSRRAYLNGVFVASQTGYSNNFNQTIGTTPYETIFGTDLFETEYFKGIIDDTRIYNRVLSDTEILALFTGSQVPCEKPPNLNPPDAPTALNASLINNTQVNLTWTDNACNETGYKIERSTNDNDNDNFVEIGTVGANVTTYTDNTISPATTYFYRVRAYNANDNSDYSNEAEVTSLALTSLTNTQLQITYPSDVDASTLSGNLHVWGEATGYRSGTFTASGRVATFTPTKPFQAGELVRITSTTGVLNTSATPMPNWVWNDEYAPVTNATNATFEDIYTGVALPASDIRAYLTPADMNQDGLIDLVFIHRPIYNSNVTVYVALQTSLGVFGTPVGIGGTSFAGVSKVADFNNDNYPDIAVSHNVPSSIAIYLNNGDGTLAGPTNYAVPDFNNNFNVGDFDGDGDIDIASLAGIASLGDNRIGLFQNNGSGSFSSIGTINKPIFGNSIDLSDLNNDGSLDIVQTSGAGFGSPRKIVTYQNDGNASYTEITDITLPDMQGWAFTVDANQDNKLDILFSGMNGVRWWEGNGNLTFGTDNSIDATAAGRSMIGDFDGNNTIDFFSGFPNGSDANYASYTNDGSGNYTQKVQQAGGMRYASNFAVDIDNDGDLDVVYMTETTGEIRIALNGNITAPTTLTAVATSPTQADLSWLDNSFAETGYKIERSTNDNSNFVEIGTVGANVTTYTDNTISPATTYFYRVSAYNANGDSEYSNEAEVSTLNAGLVAYYPFNGNANDESGNANNGTVTGATLANDRCGNPLSAYSFDGVDDYIEVLHDASLNARTGNQTRNLWIKTTDNSPNSELIIKTSIGFRDFYTVNLNNGNIYSELSLTPTFSSYCHENNITINDNEWHFISVTRNTDSGSEERIIYIDGIEVERCSFSPVLDNNPLENLYIGRRKNWQTNTFQNPYEGLIDDITIYNRALSQQEITALYEGSFVPCFPPTDLIALVNPNGVGLNWQDNSSNETRFEIERATSSGNFVSVGSVSTNETSFIDTSAERGVPLQYRVRACNSNGCSDYSNIAEVRLPMLAIRSLPTLEQQVLRGTKEHLLHAYTLSAIDLSASLNGLQVQIEGTASNQDLERYQLWLGDNIEQKTLLGTLENLGANVPLTFNFTSQTLNAGQSKTLFLTVDISPSAQEGQFVQVEEIPSSASFSFVNGAPPLSNNFPLVAGSRQTILKETIPPVLATTSDTVYFTEGAAPLLLAPSLALTDANDSVLVKALVQITENYLASEDTLIIDDSIAELFDGLRVSFNDSSGILSLEGEASIIDYQTVLQSVRYQNTNQALPSFNPRSIAFTAWDDRSQSAPLNVSLFLIRTTNFAPELPEGLSVSLPQRLEDTQDFVGEVVGDWLQDISGSIIDADSTALDSVGIALFAKDNPALSYGYWQANLGNGWQQFTLNEPDALLLSASARLRFVVTEKHLNGFLDDAINVRLWDGSQGTAGQVFAAPFVGDTTAFSKNTLGIDVDILPVNDPPEFAFTSDTLVLQEDFEGTIELAWNMGDIPADERNETISYQIVSPEFNWIHTRLEAEDQALSFDALANLHGSGELILQANDLQAEFNLYSDTVFIVVKPINDLPMFSLSKTILRKNEDFTGIETISVIPESIPENERTQTVRYQLSPSSVEFASVTIDSLSGEISISAVPDGYGAQVFEVTATDSEGGVYTQSFQLLVEPVSDLVSDLLFTYDSPFSETAPVDTLVGVLKAIDTDPQESFVYQLVDGEGSQDNDKFRIEEDRVYLASVLRTNCKEPQETPSNFPSGTKIIQVGIYRAIQIPNDRRIFLERALSAGLDRFDSPFTWKKTEIDVDGSDGWTLMGRTNGSNDNGDLLALEVEGEVPYVYLQHDRKGVLKVTPRTIAPRNANEIRLMKGIAEGLEWEGCRPYRPEKKLFIRARASGDIGNTIEKPFEIELAPPYLYPEERQTLETIIGNINIPDFEIEEILAKDGFVLNLDLSDRGLEELNIQALLSLENLQSLDISNNRLTFGEIEPLLGKVPNLIYTPQQKTDEPERKFNYLFQNLTLTVNSTGANDVVQWFKEEEAIEGATESTLIIKSLGYDDSGVYTATVQNTLISDLILEREDITVRIVDRIIEPDSLALIRCRDLLPETVNLGWNEELPAAVWPGVVAELDRVVELDLSNLGLEGELPEEIGNLTELRRLVLFKNKLSGKLPEGLGKCKKLRYLDMDDNEIEELPDSFEGLENLTTCWLSRNKIKQLPRGLGKLSKLKSFFVHRNKLSRLPESFYQLKELEMFDCSDNEIEAFETDRCQSRKLKSLKLSNNRLRSCGTKTSHLSSLETFEVKSNRIRKLPKDLIDAKKLKKFSCGGNHLGFDELEPYFRRRREVKADSIEFTYAPQVDPREPLDILVYQKDTLFMDMTLAGDHNQYRWFKDKKTMFLRASPAIQSYRSIETKLGGLYETFVTNALVPNLTIKARPIRVWVICEEAVNVHIQSQVTDTYCEGEQIFVGLETDNSSEILNWQWFRDGKAIPLAFNGNYTALEAGEYTVLSTLENGCTQLSDTMHITQGSYPEVTLEQEGNILKAAANQNVLWQWYKDGQAIEGATQNSLSIVGNGSYEVEATSPEGCRTQSEAQIFAITSLEGNDQEDDFSIYPNPVNTTLEVFLQNDILGSVQCILFDAAGKQVQSWTFDKKGKELKEMLRLEKLSSGLYSLQITVGDLYRIEKIIKE